MTSDGLLFIDTFAKFNLSYSILLIGSVLVELPDETTPKNHKSQSIGQFYVTAAAPPAATTARHLSSIDDSNSGRVRRATASLLLLCCIIMACKTIRHMWRGRWNWKQVRRGGYSVSGRVSQLDVARSITWASNNKSGIRVHLLIFNGYPQQPSFHSSLDITRNRWPAI